jgi:hypothetical protein
VGQIRKSRISMCPSLDLEPVIGNLLERRGGHSGRSDVSRPLVPTFPIEADPGNHHFAVQHWVSLMTLTFWTGHVLLPRHSGMPRFMRRFSRGFRRASHSNTKRMRKATLTPTAMSHAMTLTTMAAPHFHEVTRKEYHSTCGSRTGNFPSERSFLTTGEFLDCATMTDARVISKIAMDGKN